MRVALSGALLTSYVRAKGEALGLRIVSLGITTAFAPLLEHDDENQVFTPHQPDFWNDGIEG
ncbi:hypothetical protein KKB55_21370 [Myxococcota bacterium]|nr:hypothetical protein [Myxococcota bacterium]MBU1900300.1 hypothetical protein [Myxococcota bacterium]